MNERKVFNKGNPTEGERFFIPFPSDALHYVHHPEMNPDKLLLYALIIDYYNLQEGYAYPSIEKLSVRYGRAQDTTSGHLETLKAVGLIDYPEKGCYVPLVPLGEEDFFSKFPEAWMAYQRAVKRCDSRREDARERMRKWREERGYAG